MLFIHLDVIEDINIHNVMSLDKGFELYQGIGEGFEECLSVPLSLHTLFGGDVHLTVSGIYLDRYALHQQGRHSLNGWLLNGSQVPLVTLVVFDAFNGLGILTHLLGGHDETLLTGGDYE